MFVHVDVEHCLKRHVERSVVFAGKLVGTMLFEPVAERLGYKYTMYIAATIQCVALVGKPALHIIHCFHS